MAKLTSSILGHRIRCELIDTGVGTKVWSVRFFSERGRPPGAGQDQHHWRNSPGIAGVSLANALTAAEHMARTWDWEVAR